MRTERVCSHTPGSAVDRSMRQRDEEVDVGRPTHESSFLFSDSCDLVLQHHCSSTALWYQQVDILHSRCFIFTLISFFSAWSCWESVYILQQVSSSAYKYKLTC